MGPRRGGGPHRSPRALAERLSGDPILAGVGFPAAGARAVVVPDADAASAHAARLVAGAAASTRGRFSLVFSGGKAPRPLFRMLARGLPTPLPWERVHAFWADERCVPPGHPESNAGQAGALLLEHVPIPAGNVHRIRGEEPPERAAASYRDDLERFFGSGPPAFDLVLLGLGADGHTCSLFPGSPALESPRAAEPAVAPEGVRDRVTLTPAGLRGARRIVFLVTGRGKARAAARSLEGEGTPSELPSRALRPAAGEPLWVLDREAAAELRSVVPGPDRAEPAG